MLNSEKYLSKFVMTKSGKVDITISRTDGQKITPNEQVAICESVTNLWGMGEEVEAIPSLLDYEIMEVKYMQCIGFGCLSYVGMWVFTNNGLMGDGTHYRAEMEYKSLDKNTEYSLSGLLYAQGKRVVIVPKGEH